MKFILYSAVDQKDTTTMHYLYIKSNKSTTFIVSVGTQMKLFTTWKLILNWNATDENWFGEKREFNWSKIM